MENCGRLRPFVLITTRRNYYVVHVNLDANCPVAYMKARGYAWNLISERICVG